jgi:anti-sigma factor RsiW
MSAASYVCRDFVEDVTAYLEGSLPAARVELVEAHLADCPHCTEYLREMRLTISATGTLAADDVERLPDDVRTRLLEAFEQFPEHPPDVSHS